MRSHAMPFRIARPLLRWYALLSVTVSALLLSPIVPALAGDPPILYVVNFSSNNICRHTIAADGKLQMQECVATGKGPRTMAFDPNRRFAWVRNQADKTIVPYSIERGGKLIKQQELIQTVILSDSAQGLAVHDGGASLYAPWEIRLSSLSTSPLPSGGLHRYSIGHHGTLSLAAEIATPAIPRAVAASPNRRFILVVAQGSSRYGLQAYTTDPLTGKVLQIGATVPTESYAEDVQISSNSQVAYVVNRVGGTIGVYRTDAMSGTPTLFQTVRTGREPLKITLAANGRFAAAVSSRDGKDEYGSVSLFAIEPDGKLILKGKLETGYHPFDVGFTPDSQHFYTADFGRSSTAPSIPSTLSMYAIDAAGQPMSLGRAKTGGDGAVKVNIFTP